LSSGERAAVHFLPFFVLRSWKIMTRKITRKDLLSGCAQPGAEDGLDPRYDRQGGDQPIGSRKALQLCRQVARTLEGVLLGECNDEVLRDLIVESVVPAPHSGRLLVTVSLSPSAPYVAPEVILERLHGSQGLLRTEVAAAIHRRKAPDLLYQVRDLPR
jgi:ribosome-binding factor A